MSNRRESRWFSAGALLVLACATRGAETPRGPRRQPLIAEASVASPYTSPAHFRYHPRERARARAEVVLAGGKRLLIGERGERWLFDPKQHALSPGATLAPEPLIALLGQDGSFSFVGASGTSYFARELLSPFERSSAPIEALNSVAAGGSAIVGVRQSRSLLRSSDFGVSWSAVGPTDAAIVSVALDGKGAGLALATPEAFYGSADFGATWEKLDLPPVGALELESALDGSIRAFTPLGERRFEAGAAPGWRAAPPAAVSRQLPAPTRGPDAGAFVDGRAAFAGEGYLELVPTKERGWELLSGPLDGALTRLPVPAAKGCRAVRLAAFERTLMLACFRDAQETVTQSIELFRSESRGESFTPLPGRLAGTLGAFRMAVGAGGHWIASGICGARGRQEGCAPSGIVRARGAEEAKPGGAPAAKNATAPGPAVLSATPSLADVALALTFSRDGRIAYAVGRRTKTGRFALFVSRDGGKSFESRDLDLGQVASDDSDEEFVERSPGTRVDWISSAEDGAVAITFSHYGRRTLVVTDDQGKLLSSAEPPEGRALLSASGLRAIAIAPKSRQLWESLDGGVTWTPATPLPLDLCGAEEHCEAPVRCAPEGCVIGRELTRVGWGGQSAEESSLLPPPLRALRPPPERKLRTPIACSLSAAAYAPLPGVSEPPRAHEAAIGQAAWFAVGEDPAHAGVTMYQASKGRVEARPLLEPSTRPEEHAYYVADQVEGVAALRYRVPEAEPGKTSLSDVEVVWQNFFEGRVVHQRLADGGLYAPGDYVATGSRAQRAQPDLISIAAGGLYLRLHKAARANQPTLFLDGRRVETLTTPTWPVESRFPSRVEMVHTGGQHVPISFVSRGAALARARRVGNGFQFDAFATGMVDPAAYGLVELDNIAYVGAQAGLYVEVQDGTGAVSSAQIFPIRADGPVTDPPVPVPSQRSLGERPEACDAARRGQSSRVVAAFQPGTRHPVIVSDNVEGPRTLLTGFAVLYGTPQSPCAAAFEATGVSETGQATGDGALILLDDLEHSVFFRRVGERAPRIEYRQMVCRFDPALEIPPEVYRAIK